MTYIAPSTPYGRTDYDLGVLDSESECDLQIESFNETLASNAKCLPGSLTIGKAEIECKFRWSECQWGVLSRDKPAGIVYMDISFKQPHGFWLKNARVIITLSETKSSYFLTKARKHKKLKFKDHPRKPDSDVQIRHFGPCDLAGTENTKTQTVTTTAGLNLSGSDIVGANVGREYSTNKIKTTRWRFSGDITSPEHDQTPRTLIWELLGDQVSRERPNLPRFNTAFAFEHRRKLVYMRVEVEGQLGSKIRRAIHSVHSGDFKFSSGFGSRDDSTLTELNLYGTDGFTKALDDIANNLRSTMKRKNLEGIPVEVPRSKPAQDAAVESLTDQALRNNRDDTSADLSNKGRVHVDPTLLELGRHECGIRGSGSISEDGTFKSQKGKLNKNDEIDITEKDQVEAHVYGRREESNLPGIIFIGFFIMIWGLFGGRLY